MKKIIKFLKEIGRNAEVDWILIILISTIATVLLALGGIYLYNAVTKGDIHGPAVKVDSSREFDVKALSRVIERFDARAKASEDAQAGYNGAPDPSL